jgi:hypothetical protein
MELPNNLKLKKKDEKRIDELLRLFFKGLGTGLLIVVVVLFIILKIMFS